MAAERFFLELDPPPSLPQQAPHVVIVGGGFAGLKAAHALAGSPVRVTLIDRRNFHLFQPLLYQVATGLVSESDVASPLRQLVGQAPNVQVLMGEVVDLDPEAREVVFNDRRYRYDQLIVATGATSSFFGHDAWGEQSIPMKRLADATRIQHQVLSALEEAEQTPDAARRELLQSVVVIGGGPTGCELAASLIDLLRHTLARDFKQLDPQRCRVTLVDPGDRVLRAMDPELSRAAGEHLRRSGVELLLGGRVKEIEANRVVLTVGEEERSLEAGTICWTAGVAPSPLGRLLAERCGCPLDKGGRVIVEPDFSLPGGGSVQLQPHRRWQAPAGHGRAGGADGHLGGPRHPGGQRGPSAPPLPLRRLRQHGRDRPPVRRRRPARPEGERRRRLAAVGTGAPGLHAGPGKPPHPAHQVAVDDRGAPALGAGDQRAGGLSGSAGSSSSRRA
jgi:NADH dehydrogenase